MAAHSHPMSRPPAGSFALPGVRGPCRTSPISDPSGRAAWSSSSVVSTGKGQSAHGEEPAPRRDRTSSLTNLGRPAWVHHAHARLVPGAASTDNDIRPVFLARRGPLWRMRIPVMGGTVFTVPIASPGRACHRHVQATAKLVRAPPVMTTAELDFFVVSQAIIHVFVHSPAFAINKDESLENHDKYLITTADSAGE